MNTRASVSFMNIYLEFHTWFFTDSTPELAVRSPPTKRPAVHFPEGSFFPVPPPPFRTPTRVCLTRIQATVASFEARVLFWLVLLKLIF